MATGSLDTNGVWNYGEDDSIALFSDLLNLGTTSTSDAFTVDRARLSTIESNQEATSTFVAASENARDSRWGVPTTSAAQLLLQNLGARTVRTDTGYTERFHGIYNATSNPGGRTTAGWYPVEKSIGLTPIKPSAITFVSGSGSANASGELSFTDCSKISLAGLFDTYQRIKMVFRFTSSVQTPVLLRFRNASTDLAASDYTYTSAVIQGNAFTSTETSLSASSIRLAADVLSTRDSTMNVDIIKGPLSITVAGNGGRLRNIELLSGERGSSGVTGLSFYTAAGTISGETSFYGYQN
jgi:hypothetical protein